MSKRIFKHAWNFYVKKLGLIVLFSVPFIAAALITMLVSAPSYLAAGSVLIRTGSMPDLGILDVAITIVAFAVSIYIVSYVLTNLNMLIKEKRTKTRTKTESLRLVQKYTIKIFVLLVILKLLTVALQLGTHSLEMQSLIYPILLFIVSGAFFFIPPAVVIDEQNTFRALATSIKLVMKKPMLLISWIVVGSIMITLTYLIFFYTVGPTIGQYLTLLVNSLFVVPFLVILQSHMYMERYPLAR